MDWDLGRNPPLVEGLPDADFLLHVLVPTIGVLDVGVFSDRQIVCGRREQVKEGEHAVEGVSDEHDASLSTKLCATISFWVMGLDNPNSLVDEALTHEASGVQGSVEGVRGVSIGPGHDTHDLLDVTTEEGVT